MLGAGYVFRRLVMFYCISRCECNPMFHTIQTIITSGADRSLCIDKVNTMKLKSTRLIIFLHTFVRMLVFPILAAHCLSLENTTPEMIGLTVGVFGLTQLIMYIPMIKLSEKVGAKLALVLGFTIFAIGSVLAIFAHSIEAIAFARAVQGAGAVSGIFS